MPESCSGRRVLRTEICAERRRVSTNRAVSSIRERGVASLIGPDRASSARAIRNSGAKQGLRSIGGRQRGHRPLVQSVKTGLTWRTAIRIIARPALRCCSAWRWCYNLRFHAPVAQLDRVPGYELGGREFESLRARQFRKEKGASAPFFLGGSTASQTRRPAGLQAFRIDGTGRGS